MSGSSQSPRLNKSGTLWRAALELSLLTMPMWICPRASWEMLVGWDPPLAHLYVRRVSLLRQLHLC